MRDLPDLDSIQAFLAVAEELNFRRAAERLHLDQSAISRRIKELEHRLGFALFRRTTREVHLTEAGRVFYEENQDLVRMLRGSMESARKAAVGRAGRLRLGYMSFAAVEVMPRAVTAFAAAFPDIDLELQYMGTQVQKIALARGAIDIGFLIAPFEHADYRTLCIGEDRLMALLPDSHPLAAQPSVTLKDMARSRMVLGNAPDWDFYRWLLDALYAEQGIQLQPEWQPSSTLGILGLVSAGLGTTLYPESVGRLCPANVVMRPISDCSMRLRTVIAWKKQAAPNVEHFVRVCHEFGLPAAMGAAPVASAGMREAGGNPPGTQPPASLEARF